MDYLYFILLDFRIDLIVGEPCDVLEGDTVSGPACPSCHRHAGRDGGKTQASLALNPAESGLGFCCVQKGVMSESESFLISHSLTKFSCEMLREPC